MNADEVKTLQREIARLNEMMSKVAGEQKSISFGDFAKQYRDQKLENHTLRKSTLRSFEHQVNAHLIPGFGQIPLDKVGNRDWLRWVTEKRLAAQTLPPGPGRVTRFFNARKYLAEIILAAKEEGHVQRAPKFDNPDQPRNVGRVLEDREMLKILRNTPDDQFRFFFYTAWKTGCRPREILQWEWEMMDWSRAIVWINVPARITKTDRYRRMPVCPAIGRRLRRMHARGNGSPFVFPHYRDLNRPQMSYHGAWATSCKYAGVKNAKVYDCRRTVLTKAAANNEPMMLVTRRLDTSCKMAESTYVKAQVEAMEALVQ